MNTAHPATGDFTAGGVEIVPMPKSFSTVLIAEPVAQSSSFLRMSYHLFETANVPPTTLAIMVSVFDEVCEQLRLSPVQDRLRDIVAQHILDCVRKGRIDQDELRTCALQL